MIKSTRQYGFTLIEIMVSIAIVGVLTAIAAPELARIINQNQTKAAAVLFQDNLKQARYDSKTRSNSTVVFCAVKASLGAKQSCVENNSKIRFSNGWQWFVDRNNNFQYDEAAGDILLGNTYEVDLRELDIAVAASSNKILLNRVVFNNGEPTIVDPNGVSIAPVIEFTDANGRRSSTVTFDVTGRTTLRHNSYN